MNTTAIALILLASVSSSSAFLIFDNAQSQMNDLNTQFNNVMNETNSFLDHAWDIAKNFQNPDYDYDPSELGNYTIPNNITEAQLAINGT